MQGLARLAAGWLSFDLGSGGFTGRGAFALGAVKFVATLARSEIFSQFGIFLQEPLQVFGRDAASKYSNSQT